MTLEEYIKNPMGSFVMSNRKMYHDLYTEKWNNIKLRENGLIIFTLYQHKENYFVHFKIPSEVVPKFYYDTIVRFYLPKEKASESNSKMLTNYDVQFYSNDPSFAYTFCHAFNKNGMFIKDLESKMITKCLKDKATEKNPKDEIGYVKSLYFAYLEIKHLGLLSKARWGSITRKYDKKVWAITVTHASDCIEDRRKRGEEIAAKERVAKKRDVIRQHSTTVLHSKSSKNNLESPNQPNFGHFKKIDFNTIAKNKPSKLPGIGHFKNPFKKAK